MAVAGGCGRGGAGGAPARCTEICRVYKPGQDPCQDPARLSTDQYEYDEIILEN